MHEINLFQWLPQLVAWRSIQPKPDKKNGAMPKGMPRMKTIINMDQPQPLLSLPHPEHPPAPKLRPQSSLNPCTW